MPASDPYHTSRPIIATTAGTSATAENCRGPGRSKRDARPKNWPGRAICTSTGTPRRPWHRTFTAPPTRKLTRSCASSAAKICWPGRQCVICERATITSMADAVRPSRVACWLSSARSVAFAGEAAVTMRGAIAILGPLIPACPGSRDTGAELPLAAVRRQPRDPEPAREPAVGHDRRARDRGGLIAREEERHVRDLLGPEKPPDRVLGGQIFPRPPAHLVEQREHGRVDRAGADAVGADVPPPVLEGDRARQVDDAGLGRAVGRRQHLAEEALDRRRADDRAAAAREERGERGAHAVEDAGQHDPEAHLPHLGLDLAHVRA